MIGYLHTKVITKKTRKNEKEIRNLKRIALTLVTAATLIGSA